MKAVKIKVSTATTVTKFRMKQFIRIGSVLGPRVQLQIICDKRCALICLDASFRM